MWRLSPINGSANGLISHSNILMPVLVADCVDLTCGDPAGPAGIIWAETVRETSNLSRLFTFVKNPVRWDQSEELDSFTVSGLQRLRGAFKGLGLLYFFAMGSKAVLRSGFVLMQSSPVDYSITEHQVATLTIGALTTIQCSGIVTPTRDGSLFIAPAVKLDVPEGQDLVLMRVSLTDTPRELTCDKTTLAIPGEDAVVTLSPENGELRCLGSVSGHGVKSARIVLNRNPGLPAYPLGFDEDLCELEGKGEMSAVWKPVARRFEDILIAFHPSSVDYSSLEEVAEYLGAPEDDFTGRMKTYVVSDGIGINYTVRLILDRGLGRHDSDEARLTVTVR